MTTTAGAPARAAQATGSGPAETAPTGALGTADPRAIRAGVAPTSRAEGDPTLTISPAPARVLRPVAPLSSDTILVDGEVADISLEPLDSDHAVLVERGLPGLPGGLETVGPRRTRVILGAARRRDSDGAVLREVVIDGWRVDVELESERRASLRERAARGHEGVGKGGPFEMRAIIPGRIVAVSVGVGDQAAAGQQVLVLEAMKMQNELRTPREGRVERISVAVGDNVEVGDLLMVIK
jgi:biotin carboxyl carrier protein